MNPAARRTASNQPAGIPFLDDRKLVELVLALPTSVAMRRDCEALLPKLVEGRCGQLRKFDRDRFIRHLKANSAMPRAKPVKKAEILPHAADTYDCRETKGTALAVALLSSMVPSLGGVMPVPPDRRSL